MIYLDTHVVVWLYAGLLDMFSDKVKVLLNDLDITISPIVRLELQYLVEIGKVQDDSETIVADLSKRLGLRVDDKPFDAVVSKALSISWTRDPFDRVIVATAALDDSLLVSKDQGILANYSHARW